MTRKQLSDEAKEYGTFLVNFLNCKLTPSDLSALTKECLTIMRRYLGYDDSRWNELQITRIGAFHELVAKTEPAFFKGFIAPYSRFRALEELYSDKARIKGSIGSLRNKLSRAREISWGQANDQVRKDLFFYIEFAFLRKKFRAIFRRVIEGDTLEQILGAPFFRDFVLRFKSEYLELNQQFIIRGNQIIVAPLMTDMPNNTYSATAFFDGFLFPSLCYCLTQFSHNEENFRRVKRCSICRDFLVARDLKKKICYSSECEREYHRRDMEKRRGVDPVRYC